MRKGEGETARREVLLRNAVLAGDEIAWRTWYDETYAQLEAYVCWRCPRMRDLADDVLQESWLTAVRSMKRFRPESGSFFDWMRGIAANVVRNQLRQRRRSSRRREPLIGEPPCEHDPEIAERERSERIARALAALPENYEMVLRAKYLERQTVEQIASLANETYKAIESLLTRARNAFREIYEAQE